MKVVAPSLPSKPRVLVFSLVSLIAIGAALLGNHSISSSQSQDQLSPNGSTGTVALYTLTGSGGSTAFGDYVSSSGALNTSYRYYVEVPAGLTRLTIDLFDADIGIGGAAEATAGRDRDRTGFNTAVSYSLFNPSGSQRNTNFTTGNNTAPAGSDNAWATLFDSTGDNVRDNFAVAAYNNNNGLANWAANWIETNDDNNAANGLIQITGGQLRIRDDGGTASTIEREANLTANAFSSATLNFDFSTQSVEAGDQMRVEVSANGGGSWTTLETFTGAVSGSRSYNITSSIASNTRIRFIEVNGYTNTDSFFVDNLEIRDSTVAAGHWEVRINMSSGVTTGDDINAIGIRAHDGTSGSGGTELNIYIDSMNGIGANPPASGTLTRNYTFYPFITSGCTCSENDYDYDSNSGTTGSLNLSSRTGVFTQSFSSLSFSADDTWKRNSVSGWTTDAVANDYGIWNLSLNIGSYLVGGTPNGNYATFYMANSQAAANPPSANPAPNTFRIYLPTDSGIAPVKPYLQQRFINTSGPNPPPVGVIVQMSVFVTMTNPTAYPITFSPTNLITARVPGGGAVYGGNAQATQGSIVSQPSVGGTGDITWNPGVVSAGGTATLSYVVNVVFSSAGQRIPLTGTPAAGTGTRASYVDETGNTTQTRSTYLFGPLCELAGTAGQPTAAPATITGAITTSEGAPLSGAVVNLSGDKTDRTITDANGIYRFENVDTDGFYSVTPSRANFNFSPAQRSFTLLGDRTDAVFTAIAGSQTSNPLDDGGFFIRQQYVDFLGREPDHDGWLYWADEIDRCGFDVTCLRSRRNAVSAAFFFSEEFQQRGSFVYRLYRGGLGRRSSYEEFLSGNSGLSEGTNRETARMNFARDFVQQPEFVNRYSQAGSAEQFVDALIDNVRRTSAVDLASRRQTLLSAYARGSNLLESRTLVLVTAVDDLAFMQAEFNRSFVLMQYFGYLRREPDQGGYDFWLEVLNRGSGDNYLGLVCSFVTSAEYQQRFSATVTRGNSECGP